MTLLGSHIEKIIEYSGSIINMYSLLSHEL